MYFFNMYIYIYHIICTFFYINFIGKFCTVYDKNACCNIVSFYVFYVFSCVLLLFLLLFIFKKFLYFLNLFIDLLLFHFLLIIFGFFTCLYLPFSLGNA